MSSWFAGFDTTTLIYRDIQARAVRTGMPLVPHSSRLQPDYPQAVARGLLLGPLAVHQFAEAIAGVAEHPLVEQAGDVEDERCVFVHASVFFSTTTKLAA